MVDDRRPPRRRPFAGQGKDWLERSRRFWDQSFDRLAEHLEQEVKESEHLEQPDHDDDEH